MYVLCRERVCAVLWPAPEEEKPVMLEVVETKVEGKEEEEEGQLLSCLPPLRCALVHWAASASPFLSAEYLGG